MRLKDGKEAIGKKILIDGQQCVTALMTAIAGHPILTEDYKERVIKIAFNPLATDEEESFAVQTPAHINSKNWIPDIAELFKPDFDSYEFVDQYAEQNPDIRKKDINRAINRLLSIKSCQLGAIILVPQLDISEVTEIFVRINSQGKRLDQADFAMSKIAADESYGGNMLRKAIDYFCHLSVEPMFYNQIVSNDRDFIQSEYEPKLRWLKDNNEDIYNPDYNDMLRVSFMHTFGRGKLGDLVSLLSGRDFSDKTFKAEIAEESFKKLKVGVLNFMNQYNFEQFILTIKSAGYVTAKLLNSKMTLDFAYTIFLLLHNSNEIPKAQLKKYIQKWFVLSTLTGRYIGSPESQMDRDLRMIDSKGFAEFFKENEESMLSDTFWEVRLVQNFETSSVTSPYFRTFIAAQAFYSDRSLLSSSSKVIDLITIAGDVHHIFPVEYLKQSGFNDKSLYNQVANLTYLDTGVNISVGKRAPSDYFTVALNQCDTGEIKVGTILEKDRFWDNLTTNCLPHSIISMTAEDYPEFLVERRKQMAQKIKEYYYAL